MTFTNVEGINAYEDENAYYKVRGWRKVPTVNSRDVDGTMRMTSRQRNYYELAKGTKGRSGEQLDIWSAVYGPLGDDGYFKPLFDKRTGVIDPSVAEYWRDNYDLLEYMKTELVLARPEDRGEDPRLHGGHGHLSAGAGRIRDGCLDEDHHRSPLPRVLHVRGSEAPLLERTGLHGRAAEGNGHARPPVQAGGDHDTLVELLGPANKLRRGENDHAQDPHR